MVVCDEPVLLRSTEGSRGDTNKFQSKLTLQHDFNLVERRFMFNGDDGGTIDLVAGGIWVDDARLLADQLDLDFGLWRSGPGKCVGVTADNWSHSHRIDACKFPRV
jgi:hypothetical protein